MSKPHKHSELIKAWADGAEIQVCTRGFWLTDQHPSWFTHKEYRIKPESKPDTKIKVMVKLELIYDSETGTLKEALVLK